MHRTHYNKTKATTLFATGSLLDLLAAGSPFFAFWVYRCLYINTSPEFSLRLFVMAGTCIMHEPTSIGRKLKAMLTS